MIIYS
jgi:hypothetical protein